MIKVKWLKPHSAFAYFEGEIGLITPEWAAKLMPLGYIMLVPDDGYVAPAADVKINPLPADLPARDKLFEAGYDNVEKIEAAGDSLLDVVGISNTMLKKIKKYFKG